jgi:hypothetical protein
MALVPDETLARLQARNVASVLSFVDFILGLVIPVFIGLVLFSVTWSLKVLIDMTMHPCSIN